MKFSDNQIAALQAKLDPSHVASREQAGRKLSYIEGWWAISEANRIFGFDAWHRETVVLQETSRDLLKIKGYGGKPDYEQWRVSYLARVRIVVDGIVREGTGYGSGMAKPEALGEAIESAAKEAETDAMKRALMTFGNPFGLALYDKTQANVGREEEPAKPAAAPVQRETSFPLRKGWEYQEGDPQAKSSAQLKREGISERFKEELYVVTSLRELVAFEDDWAATARREGVSTAWKHAMCDLIEGHEKTLMDDADAAELASIPLDKALRQSIAQHPANSG